MSANRRPRLLQLSTFGDTQRRAIAGVLITVGLGLTVFSLLSFEPSPDAALYYSTVAKTPVAAGVVLVAVGVLLYRSPKPWRLGLPDHAVEPAAGSHLLTAAAHRARCYTR